MEKIPQTTISRNYSNHPLISRCALYADMNFPSRKYMEDGLFDLFNTRFYL